MIGRGKQKYAAGDKMGALSLFEDAMKQQPTKQQRQDAWYSATCVHASFGDVELAKMTLRDALEAGLDFEAALDNPDVPKLEAPTQIIIQLKKFSKAVEEARAEAKAQQAARKTTTPAPITMSMKQSPKEDIGDLFSTDIKGIDSSFAGAVRRIAILVAVCVVGYILLFNLGLKYAFPS